MARKTFFSFHYERDAWRAGQVRNSDLLSDDDEYGFIDAVEWEKVERDGEEAIKRWINSQLEYTSATVVLIGAQTSERPWVRYEIVESWNRGNAIIGVRIHGVKDQSQQTDSQGLNPFDCIKLFGGDNLSAYCPVYDWVLNDGRKNLGLWIEEAYGKRQKLTDENSPGKAVLPADSGNKISSSAPRPSEPFTPRAPWSN